MRHVLCAESGTYIQEDLELVTANVSASDMEDRPMPGLQLGGKAMVCVVESFGGSEFETRLATLGRSLDHVGNRIDDTRRFFEMTSVDSLKDIPESAGVYWIETAMPLDALRDAIHQATGKERKERKSLRGGTGFIQQIDNGLYVVYLGSDDNIRRRLGQHLFGKGSTGTGKLGVIINEDPFAGYTWRVSYTLVEDYVLRHALEEWWRQNIGWPPLCYR